MFYILHYFENKTLIFYQKIIFKIKNFLNKINIKLHKQRINIISFFINLLFNYLFFVF
jgi:hypothetical protein